MQRNSRGLLASRCQLQGKWFGVARLVLMNIADGFCTFVSCAWLLCAGVIIRCAARAATHCTSWVVVIIKGSICRLFSAMM